MPILSLLPLISAVVMAVFVFMVFRRYVLGRQSSYLLLWGIGLTMYWLAALADALHAAFGWNPLVFRTWYLLGAVLTAAWIGQGTLELLVRRKIGRVRVSHIVLALLTAISLYSGYRILTADLAPVMLADKVEAISPADGFDEQTVLTVAASVLQAGTLRHGEPDSRRTSPLAKAVLDEAAQEHIDIPASPEVDSGYLPIISTVNGQEITLSGDGNQLDVTIDGEHAGTLTTHIGRELYGHAWVNAPGFRRIVTVLMNIYGTLLLVGGAIYSSFIFLRKRIMPQRVIGNVLIAAGAMMPATGGLLNRFGLSGFLYVGELLGAIIMFVGFVQATTMPANASQSQSVATAPVGGD